ncbi:MAG: molybdate ABC transporter permease [Methylotenera sp. 24-45-7]|jgi:molybdate transport system permease protein|nr:MAG: molybdate ABC transporter permease [Mehylophilales bacterium 35-46-6]OYZ40034.1 MAG: molybdate ABC transporter permease [Methylotenera sp. 24-45-7]OZA08009.1 MAG: molybdate ABC transporter permease [Methylotenera sp. 17-45-7]OZA53241.1 MAG: molybdate ABC transporter permease [Methylophilales bacterium 39-45-7]HQS38146.1 molybdate ABC transporter permease subunit [Methylotenera sp.]
MEILDFFRFTPAEISILLLSLKVALFCVVLILVPAVAIAWVLARKSFFGKSLLDSLIHLPLVMPPVVPGFLLLLVLGNQGIIGKYLHQTFGISLAFTWMGAVVASAVMAFPLMVRSVRLAISQVDKGLEIAAQSLGAHPLRVFFSITLPLSLPGIITGLILAFSRSMGEFGATITFVGNIENETRTLPLAIYSYTQTPDGDMPALRLVILSMALALGALMVSDKLERKAQQQIGRGHD